MQELGSLGLKLAGTQEQKERYLPRLASGEWLAAYALTEAGSGSDSAAMRTTARRDGDDYVLDGSQALHHERGRREPLHGLREDRSGRRPPRHLGLPRRGRHAGLRGGAARAEDGHLRLDHRRAGVRRLPRPRGEPARRGGRGLQARDADPRPLASGRRRPGARDRAGRHRLRARVRADRETMGKPIAEHQLIAAKLADMETECEAARGLLYRFGQMVDAGVDGRRADEGLREAKLKCGDVAMWVTTEAVQILGGYGYIKEYPVERMMRDAKITQIYEGTQEIQRLVIAREMLRENRAFLLAGVG